MPYLQQQFKKTLIEEILRPFRTFEVENKHNLLLMGERICPMYTPIGFWFREMKMRVTVSNFCEEVNLADPGSIDRAQRFIEICRVTCIGWAYTLDIVALTDRDIHIRGTNEN